MWLESNEIKKIGVARNFGEATSKKWAALARIWIYLKEYCHCSGIHGFRYLSEERRNSFEKVFWAAAIVISALGCSMMISKMKTKLVSSPIIVTLAEHPTKIWHVPFPAITICPETVFRLTAFNFTKYADLAATNADFLDDFLKWVNESKIEKGANHHRSNDRHRFPGSDSEFNGSALFDTEDQRNSLYKKLWAIHTLRGRLTSVSAYPGGNATLALDEDDVEFLVEVAPTIHSGSEFPKQLRNFMMWRTQLMPLEDHFKLLWTEYGLCFTFNMMDDIHVYRDKVVNSNVFKLKGLNKKFPKSFNDWNPDKGYSKVSRHQTYPWRIPFERRVQRKGLRIVTTYNLEDLGKSPMKGTINYRMAFHQPQDHPQFDLVKYIKVPFSRVIQLSVNINVMMTSLELKKYDPHVRGCYYSNEKRLEYFKFYSQNNCELECMTNISLKMCGCVAIYMPRFKTTKICGRDAYSCLYQASLHANTAEVEASLKHLSDNESPLYSTDAEAQCDCLPACLSIIYEPDIVAIEDVASLKSLKFADSTYDFEESLVLSSTDVVVQKRFFIANQRSECYGDMDFLADCGGFVGLFCGFSILSLIEILYFLTIRLWTNIYRCLTFRSPRQLPEGLPAGEDHVHPGTPPQRLFSRIVFHQPQDHPQLNEHSSTLVQFGKLTTITANLEVMTTSPDLANYDPHKRQCYYSHEKHFKYFKVYSKSNCILECFTNISLDTCGCVQYYMPRFNSTKVCGIDSKDCISRSVAQVDQDEVEAVMSHLSASGQSPFNMDDMLSKCDCMPACLSITYEADTVSRNDWNDKSLFLPRNLPPDSQNKFVFTGARISVQNTFFIAIQRSEYYGQIDFLANCGGFLGLFCGFSILSFIEILYFLTIRIFANIYRRWTSKPPPVLPVWLPDATAHAPRIVFEDLRI